MELFVQPFQPLTGDMGIYLRGRQVRVAEHDLNAAQVRPILQQVGGEGMPEGVGRNALGYARFEGPLLDDVPKGLPRHLPSKPAQEQTGIVSFTIYP